MFLFIAVFVVSLGCLSSAELDGARAEFEAKRLKSDFNTCTYKGLCDITASLEVNVVQYAT